MLVALAFAAVMHSPPAPTPPRLDGPPRRSIMVTYRVRRGDTLWSIATELCGGGAHWHWIASENGKRPDPRHLHAGQLLAVPEVSGS